MTYGFFPVVFLFAAPIFASRKCTCCEINSRLWNIEFKAASIYVNEKYFSITQMYDVIESRSYRFLPRNSMCDCRCTSIQCSWVQFQKCTFFLYSHINLILECHLGICFKTPAPNAKKEPGQQWNLDIRKISMIYSCNNITTTLIRISRLFCFGFFSKTNHQMII